MQANVDLVFLCETWLQPVSHEADCAALTLPGFCLSLPRKSGTGGGLAVLHQTSLDILFLQLLRCVNCVFPKLIISQCFLVFTASHLVDRTS